MTRRMFAGLFAARHAKTHLCEFDKSPFYLTVAVSLEEPEYYTPSAVVNIEACKCGLLRLPEVLRQSVGYSHLREKS